MMELRALEEEDLGELLDWRSQTPEAWRTPPPYTMEDMRRWYFDIVCANPPHGYYYGIYDDNILVGQGELSGLDWRTYYQVAEIGLMIDPDLHGNGFGTRSVSQLLERGFVDKGLIKIYGEVNYCNKSIGFWNKMISKYNGGYHDEPYSKKHDGLWYPVRRFYFLFDYWKKG